MNRWCHEFEMEAHKKGYGLKSWHYMTTDSHGDPITFKYEPQLIDSAGESPEEAMRRVLELAVLEGDRVAQLALRVIVDTNPDYAEYRGTVEALNS